MLAFAARSCGRVIEVADASLAATGLYMGLYRGLLVSACTSGGSASPARALLLAGKNSSFPCMHFRV